MPVQYSAANKIFHLQGKSFSYVICAREDGTLLNLHWGSRLPDGDISYLMEGYQGSASFDPLYGHLPLEAPTRGTGFYGTPLACAMNAP